MPEETRGRWVKWRPSGPRPTNSVRSMTPRRRISRRGLELAVGCVVACVGVVTLTACGDATGTSIGVRVIEEGAVYAGEGAQFPELSGLDSLKLRAVLDLDREHVIRGAGTVTRDWDIARERRIRFVHLPLNPAEPPSLAELDWAVRILSDSSTHPILVHADGDDQRTRIVIAAYRVRAHGWLPERALREMMPDSVSGERWDSWERRLREYANAPPDRQRLHIAPVNDSRVATNP